MAGSLNKVQLIGNLGADPEIRSTQDGREIASLRIATTDSWKDRNTGERKERTEWHRVVIFSDGLVRVAKNYLRKGSKVFVEGSLQTRKWQDQSGQDRYSTEVVLQGFGANLIMLDGRAGGMAAAGPMSEIPQQGDSDGYDIPPLHGSGGGGVAAAADIIEQQLDDDIPF